MEFRKLIANTAVRFSGSPVVLSPQIEEPGYKFNPLSSPKVGFRITLKVPFINPAEVKITFSAEYEIQVEVKHCKTPTQKSGHERDCKYTYELPKHLNKNSLVVYWTDDDFLIIQSRSSKCFPDNRGNLIKSSVSDDKTVSEDQECADENSNKEHTSKDGSVKIAKPSAEQPSNSSGDNTASGPFSLADRKSGLPSDCKSTNKPLFTNTSGILLESSESNGIVATSFGQPVISSSAEANETVTNAPSSSGTRYEQDKSWHLEEKVAHLIPIRVHETFQPVTNVQCLKHVLEDIVTKCKRMEDFLEGNSGVPDNKDVLVSGSDTQQDYLFKMRTEVDEMLNRVFK